MVGRGHEAVAGPGSRIWEDSVLLLLTSWVCDMDLLFFLSLIFFFGIDFLGLLELFFAISSFPDTFTNCAIFKPVPGSPSTLARVVSRFWCWPDRLGMQATCLIGQAVDSRRDVDRGTMSS